jgi:hypothetical protein
MGKTKVNDKEVVTPASEIPVSELKELAGIPPHEKLYDTKDGRVLADDDVVPTDHRTYGATEDWDRGRN